MAIVDSPTSGEAASPHATPLPPGPPRNQPSIRKAVLGGSLWVGIGTIGSYALRIVSSVALTRLIAPDVFGMMDLAMVFIVGLHLFSDIGLGPAVIRSPNGDAPEFLQTAWTIQVVRGAILGLGAIALAVPASYAYGRPIIGQVLPLMGLLPLIESCASPGLLLMQRRIERRGLVFLDLLTSLVSLVTTIVGVYVQFPAETLAVMQGRLESVPRSDSLVWTVAIAWISGRLAAVVMSYVIAGGPPYKIPMERCSCTGDPFFRQVGLRQHTDHLLCDPERPPHHPQTGRV